MTQYHIAANGKSAPCKAQVGNCPLGGQHFASKDKADFYIELHGTPVDKTATANRAPSPEALDQLSGMMEFGSIIRSMKGNPHDVTALAPMPFVAETQYVDLDEDGSAPDPVAPKGWEYLKGFTQQYGYNGPVMHASEQLSGPIARHILENPGYYTSVVIDGMPADDDDESAPVGWGVLHYVGD